MKKNCLYASYVDGVGIPYYSGAYLTELKNHFTEVIYLYSNQLDTDSTDFLKRHSINHQFVTNEGYDFGQWKQALTTINIYEYDQLCLVNDSCILFAPLNNVLTWFNSSFNDFGGLTKSDYDKEHVQSYFLLFNKKTFIDLTSYLNSNIATNNVYQIISDFEIGLSQYLISKNYSYDSFLSNNGYKGEFSPYYQCVKLHVENGSPMIKKKILFSSYRKEELFTLARMNFEIDINPYIELIKQYNTQLILSFEKLFNSEQNKMSQWNRLKYDVTRIFIQLYKKIKK